MGINRYGVLEQTKLHDVLDEHTERIRRSGFAVAPSGLRDNTLEAVRGSLDRLIQERNRHYGLPRLTSLGEAETIRAPLAFDPLFLEIATNPIVMSVARRLMGEYIVLSQQNGIVNAPSDRPPHQSAWHRDLPYQHFVSSRPLAVNALLCVDPFEPESGATWVLPGSFSDAAFPSDEYIRAAELQIEAPAGSFIIMNSMLFHRAGWNRSKHMRRAVNTLYTLPFVKQQIRLPVLLRGRWRDDPELNRFLGYDSDSADSVEDFLALREAKAAHNPTA